MEFSKMYLSLRLALGNVTKKEIYTDLRDTGLSSYDDGKKAVKHAPNPIRKDIYVEVDWMEGHKMSSEAKDKVQDAFRWHGITLHIDDGSMGGGTSIPHDDYLTETEERNIRVNNFDSTSRGHIFYYCLFAHRNEPDDRQGEATFPFVIFDDKLGAEYDGDFHRGSHETKQASLFMHELGHDLGLDDCSNRNSAMWSPEEDSYALGRYWKVDYSSGEWNSLNLTPVYSW